MKENQSEHFMRLYEPVHDRFERFCKARAHGEINFKDLMHDTILIALERINQLKSDQAFLHFLFSIAVKTLSNQKRKNRPSYVDSFPEKSVPLGVSANAADQKIEIAELYTQLSLLDTVTRECIILFEISGFTIKEIMQIQGMGESAVKQRLSRGRKQLVEIIQSSQRKIA
jgi:RNA polymerase sigma-70 factor (ECF subfamily)